MSSVPSAFTRATPKRWVGGVVVVVTVVPTTVVVVVAIASAVLAVGWRDGAWRYQLIVGIPASFVLTLLTALVIVVFNLVPDQFPTRFYLWAWLIWF